ncbi:hypothetical protein CLV98_10910 [Dyadobacter jejuensis]|uniref:Heparinase II/III-like protein n=1 Tax=Dyadobacter jejuensis TaxID=1082580 RepID=A0A316AGX9_9BACT|nr:hypothetical protein [Dyadobacter jejuensis]PWJ56901.1 hypothetical protein CLV98_10910 [Dyadobacter jejuensis]
MLKKTTLFLSLSFFCFLGGYAQDLSSFENRRQWLLKGLDGTELSTGGTTKGKHVLPKAIARLYNNPNDPEALDYIANILHQPTQNMFDFPGVALALGKYRDLFSPAQIATLKKDLERLAKSDKKDGEGFLGHGTENHATMMWTSAYLFAQYFPDAQWVNGMTSAELMADMKERLRKTFKNVYTKGYTEYLSTTYEVVMNFPVAILYEFAEDPETKAIAEAFLLYKWSLQSTNHFEGLTMAPYSRMNTQEDYLPTDSYVSATLYQNWLYWGWGPHTQSVKLEHFEQYPETSYTIYVALSNVFPDPIFFRLGGSQSEPSTMRSSASTFGHFAGERARPHMMMRNVYRDKLFAIGTGNFRWYPGGDYADHDTNGFNIVWHSTDRFNYINCYHPYWNSDGDVENRAPDIWNHGSISPFQQTAHYQSTVITLFNIPEKDPWVNTPSKDKWLWRDAHADNLLKRGMLRYPKSVDEKQETKGWIFLREGDVFIGIKPLKPYYIQTDLKGPSVDGFNIVKSDAAKTGFIFELGSAEESGSFKNFQKKLTSKKISVDWEEMTVAYKNLTDHNIRIKFNPGLAVDADGLARSVPTVWVNGKEDIPYSEWPMIKSPHIDMDNSLLKIDGEKSTIRVDWNGDLPKITRKDS